MDPKIIAVAIIAVVAVGGGAAAFTFMDSGEKDETVSVSYVLNGGTNDSTNADHFIADVIELKDPARDHYTFDGWYKESTFQNKVTALNKADGNATVYAKWSPVTYTVTYVLNEEGVTNTNPASGTVEDAIVLTDLQKTGLTFSGWFTTSTFVSESKVTTLTPAADTTLYAKWVTVQYPITYVLNNDNVTNTNPAYGNVKETINLTDAECFGYTFNGWFTTPGFDSGSQITSLSPSQSTTLYAKWTLLTNNITYVDVIPTLNNNPATGTVEDTIVLNDPIWVSRSFVGWYTTSTFDTGTKVTTISPGSNMTLYAKWNTLEGYEMRYNFTTVYEGVSMNGIMGMLYAKYGENGYLGSVSTVIQVPINLGYVLSASYESSWPSGEQSSVFEYLRTETISTALGSVETYVLLEDGTDTIWVGKDGITYKAVSGDLTAALVSYEQVEIEETVTIQVYTGTGVTVSGSGTYALGEHVVLSAAVEQGVEFRGYAIGTFDAVLHTGLQWEFDASESMVLFALPTGQYALYEPDTTGVTWTVTDDQTGLTVAAPNTNPAIVTLPDNKSYTLKMVGTKAEQLVMDTRDLSTGISFVNTYTWTYSYGILSSLSGNMQWTGYLSDYVYFKHLNTDSRHYVNDATTSSFVRSNDSVIVGVKDYLNERASGLTEIRKANYVLQFVQEAIPYVTDAQGKSMDEYWKYPYETLYDKCGDCEDKSILFASIMKAMGYDVALVILPGHMGVGVAGIEGSTGTYIEYNEKQYYYCETTNTSYTVGVWPEGMEKVYNYFIPIE